MKGSSERVSGDKARELLAEGAQLVDVRTAGEFGLGHVDGAVNVPLQELQGRLKELDRGRPVVLYCASGNRSAQAGRLLAKAGYRAYDAGPKRALQPGGAGGLQGLLAPLLASLTLGLAPFTPEPHLVGKLRWVAGGAEGMAPIDVFDLVLHGAPWVWLLVTILRRR